MPIRMSHSYARTLHACRTMDKFYEPNDTSQEAATFALAALRYGPHGARRAPRAARGRRTHTG
jgi:hypothetical protein